MSKPIFHLTGATRDEVARILGIVAKDGLPGPRDMDVALDAIEAAIQAAHTEDDDPVDDDAEFEWIGGKLVSLPNGRRDDERTLLRLLMAAAETPAEIIATWSDDECREAEIWALASSYAASDNDDVIVPVTPAHVGRYWSAR